MCKNCLKNPVHVLLNGKKLCKKCFCNYFEKKFLKTIRKCRARKIFAKDDISIAILKKIKKIEKEKNEKAKIVLPDSLDDISASIIACLLKSKISQLPKLFFSYKNFIRPFYFLTNKEIALYAKIKNLKWKRKKKKGKEKSISDFLNEMEKKHPEIKYAIVNSFLKIQHSLLLLFSTF